MRVRLAPGWRDRAIEAGIVLVAQNLATTALTVTKDLTALPKTLKELEQRVKALEAKEAP